MAERYVAYATARSVSVYRLNGLDEIPVTYRHGNYAGGKHGVNLDSADDAAEKLGYVATNWRWNKDKAAWKALVVPEKDVPRYEPYYREGRAPGVHRK